MGDRTVIVVGYPDAELLDISCVTTTLELANEQGAYPAYQARLATPGGLPIRCVSGLVLQPDIALDRMCAPLDTLVVSGGRGPEQFAADPALVAHVRRLARRSRRVASVCTGATILAAAGLLDGRRATTHWAYARRLAQRHPTVTVDADHIYLRDGNVYTSAGITSALDLTLALVTEDHGADLARAVARTLVTYLHRPGNQAQVSMFVAPPAPEHAVVRRLVDHIVANLDGDLSTGALARSAGLSVRQLTRLVTADTGVTPARLVRRMRLEAAAHLLTTTSLSMPQVATRCGFRSAEVLRQAFVAQYATSPSRYRAAATRERVRPSPSRSSVRPATARAAVAAPSTARMAG